MPFVKVLDLVKIYGSGENAVQALRGVSMEVGVGEVVAVMGPSGSGKTTLLNIIGGVDRPTAGSVIVNGVNIVGLSEEKLREYRLRSVGYIFQFFNLIPTLTALENVVAPMLAAGVPYREAQARARSLLESLGLRGREGRFPEELSGGERQRVAIAVALANNPRIILADEPTGELDIVNAEKVVNVLVGLAREGRVVAIATHDPRVARLTDRIYALEDGRITGVYKPESLRAHTIVAEVQMERFMVEYLRKRVEDLRLEVNMLEEALRRGELSSEEYVNKYIALRDSIKILLAELSRLGAVVEATSIEERNEKRV
jgi:putative ABC transport system ATP-binding protein